MSALFWMNHFFYWVSGIAFSYAIEKKENYYKKVAVFFIFIMISTVIYHTWFWNGETQNPFYAKILMYAVMWGFQYSCWKVSKTVALYHTLWFSAIWQLVTEIWLVIACLGESCVIEHDFLAPVSLLLTYLLSYGIISKTVASWMAADRKLTLGPRQMISACLLFGVVDVLSISPELRNVSSYHGEWRFLMVCQLICIIIMYLQNELFKKTAMREELIMMDMLLKKEQEHYQMTRENIALINQKTHDLKHQIRALRGAGKEDRERYLNELEEAVHIYETIVKTGNEVLDTILTDKSLYCRDREIQISCVADGSQLEFINAIDLYAILGNALDNAIEEVEKFRNLDKRQIDVLIYRQQMFLVINIINPLDKKLVFDSEDGVPVTTKGNRHYHGFGIRSIKYLLSKYDGHLTINEEDGCFSLKMLIPIPEKYR